MIGNAFRAAFLLGLASAASAAESYSVAPRQIGSFNVIAGPPVLLPRGEHGPPGNAVDVTRTHVTKLTHLGTGKEFSYRLDGKDRVVGLGRNDGVGTEWILTPTGGDGDSEIVTIQAAEGKLKGWYLDCAEREEKLPPGNAGRTVRRLILVEKPERIQNFARFVVAS